MYSRKRISVDETWLYKRYMEDLTPVGIIAEEAGCSVALIQKRVRANEWKRSRTMSKPAWNKGLTKETDERVRQQSIDRMGVGNPMYGSDAWNKGLTKETDGRVAAIAEKVSDQPKSAEHREKLAARKTGFKGEQANRWNGGVSSVPGGYVTRIQYREDGSNYYEYEHRLTAEAFLGRALHEGEHVHHMDFDVKNNSPENLLVLGAGHHRLLHVAMDKAGESSQEFQLNWLQTNGYEYVYGGTK